MYLRNPEGEWTSSQVEKYALVETYEDHRRIRFNHKTFEELSMRAFEGSEPLVEAVTRIHNHYFIHEAVPPERVRIFTTNNDKLGVWLHYKIKES